MKPILVVTCTVIASLYSPLAHALPPMASGAPLQRIAVEKLFFMRTSFDYARHL